MTLESYAFRVAGPIDFVVNLAINTSIALFFLWNVPQVPLFGWLSAFIFLGPMVFCVFTFATFFGHLNGVAQRGRGLGGGPVAAGTPWATIGLIAGLRYAAAAVVVLLLACLLVDLVWPALVIPAWLVVLVDGLGSAVLGYLAQVNGVLRTKKFGPATSLQAAGETARELQ